MAYINEHAAKVEAENSTVRTIEGERTAVTHEVEVRLPTDAGVFRLHLYVDDAGKEHLALVMGDVFGCEGLLVRVHSECMTGDLFGSLRCDCQSQLRQAIEMIAEEGLGILIYLRQEGRGIGLLSKLHSYNLQDEGLDTVDANTILGYKPDGRDYEAAALILKDLGVMSIRLMSNNPDKTNAFERNGIGIAAMIPAPPRVTEENRRYLETKAVRFHHLIDLNDDLPYSPDIDRLLRFTNKCMAAAGDRRPFITVLLNRSLNGHQVRPGMMSTEMQRELMVIRHRLLSLHDAHLVDLSELPVGPEEAGGFEGLTVVLDPFLRIADLLDHVHLPKKTVVLTGEGVDPERRRKSENAGLWTIAVPRTEDVGSVIGALKELEVTSVLIDGCHDLLPSALAHMCADVAVCQVSPFLSTSDSSICIDGHDAALGLKDLDLVRVGSSVICYGIPNGPLDAGLP
jgi:3,4-dihydroxy 2-butanone 4-phosphate synthase/GTP cyclohydrolase II